jgi:hypothetical protein
VISSGRFPDHTMMSWENVTYPQSMRNMKRRFPRSRKTPGPAACEKGSTLESPQTASSTNAIADRPWPTMNAMPKIDEYQWGASDISQSTDAKKVVAA